MRIEKCFYKVLTLVLYFGKSKVILQSGEVKCILSIYTFIFSK